MGPTNEVQVFTPPEFGEVRTLTIEGDESDGNA